MKDSDILVTWLTTRVNFWERALCIFSPAWNYWQSKTVFDRSKQLSFTRPISTYQWQWGLSWWHTRVIPSICWQPWIASDPKYSVSRVRDRNRKFWDYSSWSTWSTVLQGFIVISFHHHQYHDWKAAPQRELIYWQSRAEGSQSGGLHEGAPAASHHHLSDGVLPPINQSANGHQRHLRRGITADSPN